MPTIGRLTFRMPLLDVKWDSHCGPIVILSYGKKRLGFALICHRKPERSFRFFGHQSLLCSRCTGLALGLIASLALLSLGITLPMSFATILMIPMLIDGFSQLFGLRESNNTLRLLTGLLFAVGSLSILLGVL